MKEILLKRKKKEQDLTDNMKRTDKDIEKLNQLDRLEWLLLSNRFHILDLYNFIFASFLLIIFCLNINFLISLVSLTILIIILIKSMKRNTLFKKWISNKFFQIQPKNKRGSK